MGIYRTGDVVTTHRILDQTIASADILDNAIITAKILNDAVTTAKVLDSAITTAKMDNTLVKHAAVEISSADILALYTTPKPLIAAPGAGYALDFISLLLAYDYGATAYTIGTATDLQVKYTDAAGAAASVTQAVTGFIDQAADQIRLLDKLEAGITPVANAALVLTLGVADVTAGDGVIHAKVVYRVLATGL